MAKVMPGRYTAQTGEPFVVFLIGMRINRFFAFRKWIPTALAMGPMLRTLFQHPEKGFLGGELIFYWRGVGLIQYWRSFEDLEKFARNREDPHLHAWQRFNKAIGTDGSVASGMKPTWSSQGAMRRYMAICPSLAWHLPLSMYQPWGVVRLPAVAWAAKMSLLYLLRHL